MDPQGRLDLARPAGFMAQVLKTDQEPLAPVPSGENVPSFCLYSKLERLPGVPLAVYCTWDSLVIQTVLQVISLVLLVWFNFCFPRVVGTRVFPVDHLVCYCLAHCQLFGLKQDSATTYQTPCPQVMHLVLSLQCKLL